MLSAAILGGWVYVPGLGGRAHANDAKHFPIKPVRFIVPFPPGGATDIVGRLVAQRLSDYWKQTIVVENRTGASGNIGADAVAKSAPDGYTILVASGSILTVNRHLFRPLPFDSVRDFSPITNIASGPMLLVVHPQVAATNLKEFLSLARDKPGALTFGSAGIGSQIHLASELVAAAAQIDVRHVPYRGAGPALADLTGGQIHFMTDNIASSIGLVQQGRLRALGITSRERSKLLPDVPTLVEQGLPDFETNGWFGLVAPGATPRDIVAKIQADTARVLDSGEVRGRLFVQGLNVVANKPDAFRQAIENESKGWAKVIEIRRLAVGQ